MLAETADIKSEVTPPKLRYLASLQNLKALRQLAKTQNEKENDNPKKDCYGNGKGLGKGDGTGPGKGDC